MGVIERQENVSTTGSGWDSEVAVVVQASEVVELRSSGRFCVGTGEGGWFPRSMTQYLCTWDANFLLRTKHVHEGLRITDSWLRWTVTGRTERPVMICGRQLRFQRSDVVRYVHVGFLKHAMWCNPSESVLTLENVSLVVRWPDRRTTVIFLDWRTIDDFLQSSYIYW